MIIIGEDYDRSTISLPRDETCCEIRHRNEKFRDAFNTLPHACDLSAKSASSHRRKPLMIPRNLIAARHEVGMRCVPAPDSRNGPVSLIYRTLYARLCHERQQGRTKQRSREAQKQKLTVPRSADFAISANTPPARSTVTDVRPFNG